MSSVEQVVRDVLVAAIEAGVVERARGGVPQIVRMSDTALSAPACVLAEFVRLTEAAIITKIRPAWLPLFLWRQPDGRFGFSGLRPLWAATSPGGPLWALPRTHEAEGGETLLDGMFHQNVCATFVQEAFGDNAANIQSGISLPIELAARQRERG